MGDATPASKRHAGDPAATECDDLDGGGLYAGDPYGGGLYGGDPYGGGLYGGGPNAGDLYGGDPNASDPYAGEGRRRGSVLPAWDVWGRGALGGSRRGSGLRCEGVECRFGGPAACAGTGSWRGRGVSAAFAPGAAARARRGCGVGGPMPDSGRRESWAGPASDAATRVGPACIAGARVGPACIAGARVGPACSAATSAGRHPVLGRGLGWGRGLGRDSSLGDMASVRESG
ncbi:hypothetical protein GCM10018965_096410 [Nonomuraea roseola]